MFPWSIEGEVELGAIDDEEASRRLDGLLAWLRKEQGVGPRDSKRLDDVVTFRTDLSRFFLNSMSPLSFFGSGTLELDRRGMKVRHELSCRQLLVFASVVFLLVAGLVPAILTHHAFFLGAGVLGWLWVFGVSYLISGWRTRRLLRRNLVPVVAAPEPSPPPTRF